MREHPAGKLTAYAVMVTGGEHDEGASYMEGCAAAEHHASLAAGGCRAETPASRGAALQFARARPVLLRRTRPMCTRL